MEKKPLSRSILWVAIVTLLILSIPLVAMQFTNEVDWSIMDFIIMGVLLFGTGVLFALVMRLSSNIVYKIAVGLAVGTAFFMTYVNLAVGLIGSGPHAGNLMYVSVILVLIIGVFLSRFTASGMERAMYLTAGTFAVLTAIAFMAKMYEYPSSSVIEVIGVNTFLATPFIVSGLLFRYVAMGQANKSEKTA